MPKNLPGHYLRLGSITQSKRNPNRNLFQLFQRKSNTLTFTKTWVNPRDLRVHLDKHTETLEKTMFHVRANWCSMVSQRLFFNDFDHNASVFVLRSE